MKNIMHICIYKKQQQQQNPHACIKKKKGKDIPVLVVFSSTATGADDK